MADAALAGVGFARFRALESGGAKTVAWNMWSEGRAAKPSVRPTASVAVAGLPPSRWRASTGLAAGLVKIDGNHDGTFPLVVPSSRSRRHESARAASRPGASAGRPRSAGVIAPAKYDRRVRAVIPSIGTNPHKLTELNVEDLDV